MPNPHPPFADVEYAREQASRGGQRRAELDRLRQDNPEEYLRQRFAKEAPKLVSLLLQAAKGEGDFTELPPEKRLAAITQALAYGVGRPSTQKPAPPKEQEKATPGLVVE